MIANLLRRSVQLIPWNYRNRIKDWPGVAHFQRWLLKRFMVGNEFLHTIDAGPARGLNYWVRFPEDKNIWTGTYESGFAAVLAQSVRAGDLCLDIGGYRGFFAGVCAIAGAREVHIFEPLPDNARKIRRLIEANPDLSLTLHELALGNARTVTDFLVMPEASMGKLDGSQFQREDRGSNAISVTVETLDHLQSSGMFGAPNVVKIDVEGAEAMVIRGGERTLQNFSPALFIEIHSRDLAKECDQLLRNLGYACRVLETNQPPDFTTEPEVCHFIGDRP